MSATFSIQSGRFWWWVRSWWPSEMPIWSNERLLPSWASSKVATRVESVWNARTSMSNMSWTCSA